MTLLYIILWGLPHPTAHGSYPLGLDDEAYAHGGGAGGEGGARPVPRREGGSIEVIPKSQNLKISKSQISVRKLRYPFLPISFIIYYKSLIIR